MSEKNEFIIALEALEPVLSNEGKKGVKAVLGIQGLFPGEKLSDIERQVRTLLQATRTTLPVMKKRALALCDGQTPSDMRPFMDDAKSLSTAAMKTLGRQLKIALEGNKVQILAHLETWITSRGEINPPDPLEQEKAVAREFGERAKPYMSQLSTESMTKVIDLLNQAYKAVKKAESFKAFGRALGLEVSGTKPTMKKSLISMLNRIAVSQKQTDF